MTQLLLLVWYSHVGRGSANEVGFVILESRSIRLTPETPIPRDTASLHPLQLWGFLYRLSFGVGPRRIFFAHGLYATNNSAVRAPDTYVVHELTFSEFARLKSKHRKSIFCFEMRGKGVMRGCKKTRAACRVSMYLLDAGRWAQCRCTAAILYYPRL